MLNFIGKRVSYANVTVTLALVFAMTGGAYAASKYLITSTKQISPKVLKSLKGKNGKNGNAGVAGPAGAAGPQGPAGANGKDGVNGKDGTNGANGTNGKNVRSIRFLGTEEPPSKPCGGAGGSEFEIEGSSAEPTYVCNGGGGTEGYPETLPEGKTETGTLSLRDKQDLKAGERVEASTAISFPIPLPEPAEHAKAAKIEYVKVALSPKLEPEPTGNANCPGFKPTPQAAKGYLCIYSIKNFEQGVSEKEGVRFHNAEALLAGVNEHYASRTGVTLDFESDEATSEERIELNVEGAWAVTAA